MVQEVLSVPDVSCNHCVSAIEGAVGGLQGVQSVTVDLDRKDVTIRFDDCPGRHRHRDSGRGLRGRTCRLTCGL
jgi:copper chaperone